MRATNACRERVPRAGLWLHMHAQPLASQHLRLGGRRPLLQTQRDVHAHGVRRQHTARSERHRLQMQE
jgi:hypothetical protein